jgi:phenylalanyl-tRNA synthetase beta subunit
LLDLISTELEKQLKVNGYFSTTKIRDIYQSDDDKKHKNINLRFWLSHPAKTLKTDEVNSLLSTIAKEAHEKLSAVRV